MSCFFEETILLANIRIAVTLEIFFPTLSNVDINFSNQELRWGSYTTAMIFSITRQVKLVGKKEFTTTSFDSEDDIFVVYIAIFANSSSNVQSFW